LHDGGIYPERNVVDEQTISDRRVVDAALDAIAERIEAVTRVLPVDPEVEGEVVARAGRDSDEGEVVLN